MASSTTLRILLVEDDRALAQSILKLLQRLDVSYQVDLGISAEEGLALWRAQHYDVLLTDHNLRGISGLSLITTLKQESPQTPMVLFTAYDTPELREAARAVGVAAYLVKPFFLDRLVNLASSLLIEKARGDDR